MHVVMMTCALLAWSAHASCCWHACGVSCSATALHLSPRRHAPPTGLFGRDVGEEPQTATPPSATLPTTDAEAKAASLMASQQPPPPPLEVNGDNAKASAVVEDVSSDAAAQRDLTEREAVSIAAVDKAARVARREEQAGEWGNRQPAATDWLRRDASELAWRERLRRDWNNEDSVALDRQLEASGAVTVDEDDWRTFQSAHEPAPSVHLAYCSLSFHSPPTYLRSARPNPSLSPPSLPNPENRVVAGIIEFEGLLSREQTWRKGLYQWCVPRASLRLAATPLFT